MDVIIVRQYPNLMHRLMSKPKSFLYATYMTHKYTKILWEISGTNHPWASCQIRKIAGCACAGNAGIVSPHRRLQKKSLVSDPGMHHGTCVTHVPWCMSGSFTRGGGENVPGIPGACATRNFTYLVRGPLINHRCTSPVIRTPSCVQVRLWLRGSFLSAEIS